MNADAKNEKERLTYLDSLKGLMIIFIIITHSQWSDSQRLLYGFPFYIDMAVPVFLIITGYLYTKSACKNNRWENIKLRQLYDYTVLSRFTRYLVPYALVFIFEQIVSLHENGFSMIRVVKEFVYGGAGPGGYYVPVMLQLVLLFPVVFIFLRKKPKDGLIALFILNATYELIKDWIGLSESVYRLFAVRYLFIFGFGIYLYLVNKMNVDIYELIAGVFGFVYIIYIQYGCGNPGYWNQWKGTSAVACLLAVPIMTGIVFAKKFNNKFFCEIGMASWNIFLFQCLYYYSISKLFYNMIGNQWMRLLLNIIICCGIGYIFFRIENPITSKLIRTIKDRHSKYER